MSYQRIANFFLNHFVESCVIIFILLCLAALLFNRLSGFAKLKSERESLQKEKKLLDAEKSATDARHRVKEQELSQKAARLNNQVRARTIELAKDIASRDYLSQSPVFSALSSNTISYDRLLSSLTGDMQICPPFDIHAAVRSGSEIYETTLYHCSCPDHQFRRQPCKHMMRLGLEVGMLMDLDKQPLEQEVSSLIESRRSLLQERDDIAEKRQLLRHLEQTQEQSFPWLVKLRADAYETAESQWVDYLQNKNRPAAQKAAEVGSIIHGELRQARIAAKQAEYQVHFYESLFPWLLDYKELPPADAFSYVQNSESTPAEDESAIVSRYLSPQEWAELSDTDRYQLILDRYIARSKTNWEIGIEYERYIGYLCEQQGYSVTYNGARTKLEDMGRDLILRRGDEVVLVQCKRWAAEKTVHENHVFQLAGSVFEYQYQHPQQAVSGALVTSTSLSEVAQRCAEYLGIRIFSGVPFQEYPRIKCNIGKSGQKIYHLPVDQQYDTALIDSPGEFYAATVAEAETAGFRRAYRWRSSNAQKE